MRIDRDQIERAASQLPIGRDPASVRRRLEAMEAILERAFVVPGTSYRIGADALVGLVPVVGDLIGAAMGAWLVWEARNLGMSRFQQMRMAANVGIDTLFGAVPLVGDAFDFLFRSNTKNMRIIRRYLDKHHPETMTIDAKAIERRP